VSQKKGPFRAEGFISIINWYQFQVFEDCFYIYNFSYPRLIDSFIHSLETFLIIAT